MPIIAVEKSRPADPCAARRRHGRHVTRTARDIERACAGGDLRGIEQGRDERRGRVCERAAVARGGALPAGMLERANGLGLEAHGRTS